jgi:hypothetical protein
MGRRGLVISALAHMTPLAAALLLARADTSQSVPDPIPPDAMQVEIVMPKEAPRYSGTPSSLRTSGTDQAAQGQPVTPHKAQPAPPTPQPKDEQQQATHDAPPKTPKPEPQETPPPQAKEPPPPPSDDGQVAMAQPAPDPATPSPEQRPETADAATTAAFLALAGGQLGGGFAAPPINSPLVGYDFTVPFRELVASCQELPPDIGWSDRISITVRVFLNRDGTLPRPPQLLEANPSTEQRALMQAFIVGLQKCQPYTMLPPDDYKQWKMLDLVVRPHNRATP